MLVEDGSELTRQAWSLLEADGKALDLPDLRVQAIRDFLESAEQHRTSPTDRQTILDQALLMFDHLYPHMPFKADIYHFTHPSDYLRQEIQPSLASLSEIDFHTGVIAAFSLVRDAHTLYGLPSPFRGAVAFLPFQIRPFLDKKAGWRFIVTSVMETLGDQFFNPGTEIVGWGELDALAHVERTATHLPGGNYFANITRGSIHSTLRPLTFVQVPFPDELPDATLRYRAPEGGEIRAIRIPWAVATGLGSSAGFPKGAFSVSPAAAMAKSCGKVLHRRDEMRDRVQANLPEDPNQFSTIPEMFDFRYTGSAPKKGSVDLANLADKDQPDARFGYLRIKAFSDGSSAPGSTDRIVKEFQRIVTLMDRVAPDGLLIDIRGNPGGDVQAAERMLQMLTPRPIEPARFHLANTMTVLDILRSLEISGEQMSTEDAIKLSEARSELEAWIGDADQPPLPAGSPLTTGKPLTDPDGANEIGQVYHGRGVALIIDSLTYSAADIFAAGFQDHGAGILLGTSLVTGGGGANVWSHEDLVNKLGPKPGIPLATLPGDVSMSLAIRRSSRVGPSEGQPIEDQGVTADVFYWTESVEDLVAGSPGILRRASKELSRQTAYRVDAGPPSVEADGSVIIEVQTTNIANLKFFLNGHLASSVQPSGSASQTFSLPAAGGASPSVLRIEGYDAHLQLVRARTIHLQEPVIPSGFDPATESITGTDPGA